MNIVMKNLGKKSEKKFFKKHTNRVSKKCWKKIVSKKFEKMFFNIHMNIETIKGGKKARKNFIRNIRIMRDINDGKNRLEKVRKHVFYKHM